MLKHKALIKLTFTASSSTFFSEAFSFLFIVCAVVRNTMTTAQIGGTALIHGMVPTVLLTFAFVPPVQM